jgi:hypothetical protein
VQKYEVCAKSWKGLNLNLPHFLLLTKKTQVAQAISRSCRTDLRSVVLICVLYDTAFNVEGQLFEYGLLCRLQTHFDSLLLLFVSLRVLYGVGNVRVPTWWQSLSS